MAKIFMIYYGHNASIMRSLIAIFGGITKKGGPGSIYLRQAVAARVGHCPSSPQALRPLIIVGGFRSFSVLCTLPLGMWLRVMPGGQTWAGPRPDHRRSGRSQGGGSNWQLRQASRETPTFRQEGEAKGRGKDRVTLSRSGNQLGPGLGRLAVLALTNTGEGWVGCLLQ
eukprot:COSAG01_NODE_35248_length_534_cov_15.374713_1_plen_168_part_01